MAIRAYIDFPWPKGLQRWDLEKNVQPLRGAFYDNLSCLSSCFWVKPSLKIINPPKFLPRDPVDSVGSNDPVVEFLRPVTFRNFAAKRAGFLQQKSPKNANKKCMKKFWHGFLALKFIPIAFPDWISQPKNPEILSSSSWERTRSFASEKIGL